MRGHTNQPSLPERSLPRQVQINAGYVLAECARQTVHRWLANDAEFIAAYNRGRHELANSHATRILAMCGQALDVLEGAIAGGDARVSLAVLKGAGMLGGEAARIEGSSDPDEVRNEQARRVKAQELNNLIAGI